MPDKVQSSEQPTNNNSQPEGAARWGGLEDRAALLALAGRVDVILLGMGAEIAWPDKALRAAATDKASGMFRSILDGLQTYSTAAKLTSPITHLNNTIGNMLNFAVRPVEKIGTAAALIGQGDPIAAQAQTKALFGTMMGYRSGLERMVRAAAPFPAPARLGKLEGRLGVLVDEDFLGRRAVRPILGDHCGNPGVKRRQPFSHRRGRVGLHLSVGDMGQPRALGADHAIDYRGEDGLDELTLSGRSTLWTASAPSAAQTTNGRRTGMRMRVMNGISAITARNTASP